MADSLRDDMAYLDVERARDFEILGKAESIAEMFAAVSAARADFEPIYKNRHVDVRKDGKLLYGFDYADMEEILKKTTAALSKHGLSVVQPASSTKLRTMLVHKSGACMVSTMDIPAADDPKSFGGNITFLRRYAYSSLLCLAADQDADDMPEPKRGETSAEAAPRAKQERASAPVQEPKLEAPTDEQRAKVRELLKACGAANPIQAGALAKELAGCALSEISRDKADAFIIALGKRAIALKEAQS